jgi:hypothetical protein
MRSNYPTFIDYQSALEDLFEQIGKDIAIQSYEINALPTNLEVKINDPSAISAIYPNITVVLGNVLEGFDDSQTGKRPVGSKQYTKAGSNIRVSTSDWPQRLIFEIVIQAQQYKHCLAIMEGILRALNYAGFMTFVLNDKDINVRYRLDNFKMAKYNDKNIFEGSYLLTLHAQEDPNSDVSLTLPITTVSASFTGSIG